ncbi:MAG TPA: hypothetical protein VHL80_05775 [Polyangia bacterium]|nr:hypothetical protein [Polyangia bacterium]
MACGAAAGCRIGEGDVSPRNGSAGGGNGGTDGADMAGPSGAAGSARVISGAAGASPDGGAGDGGGSDGSSLCKPGDARCFGVGLSTCTPAGGWGPILLCGTNLTCAARGGAAACVGTSGAAPPTGTWTAVKQRFLATSPSGAPAQPGTAQLLTDGRVLASGPEASARWFMFTPDAFGSYENGTWAPAASSPVGRLFHPSFVLRDGRYWSGGGEYVVGATTRAANEVYDPAADAWSPLPDMPEDMADTPAALLGDGRVLVLGHRWASMNTYVLSFDPLPAWSLTAPWSYEVGDQESSSTTLQDGSVIVGSRLFDIFLPGAGVWISAAPPPGGAGVFQPPNDDEMGPILVLRDGRALVLGANEKNAVFTPGGRGGAGSWTPAADTPSGLNHSDAPSAVEPDGKVLSVVTKGDGDDGGDDRSAALYEYDPTADAWTLLPTPFAFDDVERVILLVLPNGQIWASGSGSATAWLYTPAGAPRPEWRPSLGGFAVTAAGSFALTGQNLNGATPGADFGDDAKMGTGFPVVSFVDAAGHVYYGRSSDFDDMTPTRCASARVVPPAGIPDGAYAVHVAASGVGEDQPGQVTFAGPRAASLVAGPGVPGEDAPAVLTLTAPAPAGGTTVSLASSDPEVAAVPPSLVVPEGAASASFTIHCTAGTGHATIQAATANSPAFAASTVFGWSVTSLAGPSAAPDGTPGAWTVEIDHPAPLGGLAVGLASSNAALVTVPASVTVPEGRRRATFVPTLEDPGAGTARLYATLSGSSQSGLFGWTVATLTGPASTPAGTTATWTVALSGPAPTGGLIVALATSDANVAGAPNFVVVPAGQASATFPVKVLASATGATTKATVTAAFDASYLQTSFDSLPAPASPTLGRSDVALSGR